LNRSLAASLVLFAAAQPLDARAFTVKETSTGAEVHWSKRSVAFDLHALGDKARDKPLFKAALGAAAEWTAAGEVQISVTRPSATATVGFDNGQGNVIAWSSGEWPGDEDDLALTFLHYDVRTGVILDADIVLNDTHHAWHDADVLPRDSSAFDIANVLTHEMGHALGLDHSTVQDATMFPSSKEQEISKRDLHDDDREALAVLYANVVDTGTSADGLEGAPRQGCQAMPLDTPVFALLFVLGAWLLGSARIRREGRCARVDAKPKLDADRCKIR